MKPIFFLYTLAFHLMQCFGISALVLDMHRKDALSFTVENAISWFFVVALFFFVFYFQIHLIFTFVNSMESSEEKKDKEIEKLKRKLFSQDDKVASHEMGERVYAAELRDTNAKIEDMLYMIEEAVADYKSFQKDRENGEYKEIGGDLHYFPYREDPLVEKKENTEPEEDHSV